MTNDDGFVNIQIRFGSMERENDRLPQVRCYHYVRQDDFIRSDACLIFDCVFGRLRQPPLEKVQGHSGAPLVHPSSHLMA